MILLSVDNLYGSLTSMRTNDCPKLNESVLVTIIGPLSSLYGHVMQRQVLVYNEVKPSGLNAHLQAYTIQGYNIDSGSGLHYICSLQLALIFWQFVAIDVPRTTIVYT